MRKIKNTIFMGTVDSTIKQINLLRCRLEEGINTLSALQQPDHAENEMQTAFLKNQRKEMKQDLKDIILDIRTGLGDSC